MLSTDHPAYRAALPGLGLFVQPHWLQLFDGKAELYGISKGDALLAVHHVYRYAPSLGEGWINTPMAPHCAFAMLQPTRPGYAGQSELKRVLRTMADAMASRPPHHLLHIALPPKVADVQPFLWKKMHIMPRYTYLLHVQAHDSDLMAAMSAERRKNIRDAYKAGYALLQNEQLLTAVQLATDTLTRQGETPHAALLQRLVQHAGSGWCHVLIAQHQGEPRAAAIIGTQGGEAYYLAGGHLPQDSLAASWLLWEAIKMAREAGCNTFDFMGSMQPGIEQFFRAFGGSLTPYFAISRGTTVYNVMKKIKKKLAI